MTAKSDLPQGTLDLLILKVIALGPVHGYAIAQRLQQVSCDVVQVPQGSLYPALHRLENRSLLAADWKVTETGREAKFEPTVGPRVEGAPVVPAEHSRHVVAHPHLVSRQATFASLRSSQIRMFDRGAHSFTPVWGCNPEGRR